MAELASRYGIEIQALVQICPPGTARLLDLYVYHCGCRNRRVRYLRVLKIGQGYARGEILAQDAVSMLMSLVDVPSVNKEPTPHEDRQT